MKVALLAATAFSAAALAAAPQAHAASFVETFYGVIDTTTPASQTPVPTVTDVAGLFGGGNLQGDLITANFSYNTSLGTMSSGYDYNTGYNYVSLNGGFDFDGVNSSPVKSVTYQIYTPLQTYTYTYTPDARGTVLTEPGQLLYDVGNSVAGDESLAGLVTPLAPNNVSTPYLAATFPDLTTGNYLDPSQTNTGQLDTITFDTFAVQNSAVPEPTTWSLMIAGLGALGLMLRRSRRLSGAALA